MFAGHSMLCPYHCKAYTHDEDDRGGRAKAQWKLRCELPPAKAGASTGSDKSLARRGQPCY